MLNDRRGRRMRSLRISLTDACNLRCRYCMPGSGCAHMPAEKRLEPHEFARLAALFAREGVRKFKLTGGEPMLYPGLEKTLALLSGLEGVDELSMTTNGTLLRGRAGGLASAGLDRITVSLDSLDGQCYRDVTRGGCLTDVLEGMMQAQRAGLGPLKVNCVLLREWNLDEAMDLTRFAMKQGWEMRFIEFMPLVRGLGIHPWAGVPTAELQARLGAKFGQLRPVEGAPGSTAERFRVAGWGGTIGFISPMSRRFCAACDRLRLGPDGYLRLCMGHDDGLALGEMMRRGADDAELGRALRTAVWNKPEGHSMDSTGPGQASMSAIGG